MCLSQTVCTWKSKSKIPTHWHAIGGSVTASAPVLSPLSSLCAVIIAKNQFRPEFKNVILFFCFFFNCASLKLLNLKLRTSESVYMQDYGDPVNCSPLIILTLRIRVSCHLHLRLPSGLFAEVLRWTFHINFSSSYVLRVLCDVIANNTCP